MTPLERYHPERYRLSRPFSRQIITTYRNYTRIGNAPTSDCFQAVADCIANSHNNLPFDERTTSTRSLMKEISLSMHYASFYIHGRQVFHFNDEISKQFRKTDIDEIKIECLAFPYDVFYMGFGRQFDLRLDDVSFVDGAYISVLGQEDLQIMLTTIQDGYDLSKSWILQTDKYYYLSLSLRDRSSNIATVASKALQEDLAERQQDPLANEPNMMEFQGVTVINRRSETLKTELEEVGSGYSVFWEALRLVINGLCYVSAYREDIEARYPDDTPSNLLDKLQNPTKPKDSQRAASKLTSMGYTKIHYCGKAFERLKNKDQTTGKEIKTHWRRGHWRNQPHGSGLLERKLIWIMPVIIRKDRSESLDELGHIYMVEEPLKIETENKI
jgi:hypothetical protein